MDLFICHASEDKEDVARPLAMALATSGARVWFDEFVLRVGDSLRDKIDEGLRSARFGVVIFSPHFFRKQWPANKLNALFAREMAHAKKVILPVWTMFA